MAYSENIRKLILGLCQKGKSAEEVADYLSELKSKTGYSVLKAEAKSLGLAFTKTDWQELLAKQKQKEGLISPKTIRYWQRKAKGVGSSQFNAPIIDSEKGLATPGFDIGDLKITLLPSGIKALEFGPPMSSPQLPHAWTRISIPMFIDNPTRASITLSDIRYQGTINGNYTGEGSITGTHVIPAHAIAYQIDASFIADYRNAGSVAFGTAVGGVPQMVIKGTAHYDRGTPSEGKPGSDLVPFSVPLPLFQFLKSIETNPADLLAILATLLEKMYANENKALTNAISVQAYIETPHKQQMRESAKNLMRAISLPWIMESFIIEMKPGNLMIGHRRDALLININNQDQLKIEIGFEGDILEGLRSHLQTGGFSGVVVAIDKWKIEAASYLFKCYKLLKKAREKVGQDYKVSIPKNYQGLDRFDMSFPETACADAIEQLAGTYHFKDFPYSREENNLKFGSYIIYYGVKNQDLGPFEEYHRKLAEECLHWTETKEISEQRKKVNEIQKDIRRQLNKFTLLERVPGKCDLCS